MTYRIFVSPFLNGFQYLENIYFYVLKSVFFHYYEKKVLVFVYIFICQNNKCLSEIDMNSQDTCVAKLCILHFF